MSETSVPQVTAAMMLPSLDDNCFAPEDSCVAASEHVEEKEKNMTKFVSTPGTPDRMKSIDFISPSGTTKKPKVSRDLKKSRKKKTKTFQRTLASFLEKQKPPSPKQREEISSNINVPHRASSSAIRSPIIVDEVPFVDIETSTEDNLDSNDQECEPTHALPPSLVQMLDPLPSIPVVSDTLSQSLDSISSEHLGSKSVKGNEFMSSCVEEKEDLDLLDMLSPTQTHSTQLNVSGPVLHRDEGLKLSSDDIVSGVVVRQYDTGVINKSSDPLAMNFCVLCRRNGGDPLLPYEFADAKKNGTTTVYIHEDCAVWSPEVYVRNGQLKNVDRAIRRGNLIRCAVCHEKGATIGCRVKKCRKSYHLPCLQRSASKGETGCLVDEDSFTALCPQHRGGNSA